MSSFSIDGAVKSLANLPAAISMPLAGVLALFIAADRFLPNFQLGSYHTPVVLGCGIAFAFAIGRILVIWIDADQSSRRARDTAAAKAAEKAELEQAGRAFEDKLLALTPEAMMLLEEALSTFMHRLIVNCEYPPAKEMNAAGLTRIEGEQASYLEVGKQTTYSTDRRARQVISSNGFRDKFWQQHPDFDRQSSPYERWEAKIVL